MKLTRVSFTLLITSCQEIRPGTSDTAKEMFAGIVMAVCAKQLWHEESDLKTGLGSGRK